MRRKFRAESGGNGLAVLLLLALISVQQLLPVGTGRYFGTVGDWYSQHTAAAETLRQAMLESGRLIPQYLPLGGGSSGYDFAYYGLLRPDVLLGCLFPSVEMKDLVAGYALLGIYASGVLCFFWLKTCRIPIWFSFAGAALLVSSSAFYQAHNQIMFVNYMPFLILALWGIGRVFEKKSPALLAAAVFLIAVHSFYYLPACLCAAGIYTIHLFLRGGEGNLCGGEGSLRGGKDKKEKLRAAAGIVAGVVLAVGMAMILLLPVGLDILSTGKDAGKFAEEALTAADPGLAGLLYSPYSCGMTALSLYCLLAAFWQEGSRFLAGALLLGTGLPAVSLVLNGFLYAREKILIPFVPLLALLCAETLWKLYKGELKHRPMLLLLCLGAALVSEWKPLMLLDTALLGLWILVQKGAAGRNAALKRYSCLLCLCFPGMFALAVNGAEFWEAQLRDLGISISTVSYLEQEDSRQDWYGHLGRESIAFDRNYRMEVLADGFVNSNLARQDMPSRTSMYSSVSNSGYGTFFYDTMKNPISYNNRVALAAGENPCFACFMGIRYVITKEGQVPEGYTPMERWGEYVLSENPRVRPVCYGAYDLMSLESFEKLEFPETLLALCSRGVVRETGDTEKLYSPGFWQEDPETFFAGDGVEKLLSLHGKKESFGISLEEPLSGKVLILQFQVESQNKGAAVISVNGIKNKLSSEKAPYPNGNHTFTYVMDTGDNLEELWIEASKGDYRVENLKIWLAEESLLHQEEISIPEAEPTVWGKGELFSGNVDMEKDGYFITSYPWREGYEILADGEAVEGEMVNTAFLGFPLDKGEHQIEISFEAPGYTVGKWISAGSFGIFGVLLLWGAAGKYRTAGKNIRKEERVR